MSNRDSHAAGLTELLSAAEFL